jgi:integral membrane protein
MIKTSYSKSISRFRIIAISEGISYLLLLFIAMPLKYFAGIPEWVKFTGWIHGILFMFYMLSVAELKFRYNWSFKNSFLAVIASLLPFGPFIFDKKILKGHLVQMDLK